MCNTFKKKNLRFKSWLSLSSHPSQRYKINLQVHAFKTNLINILNHKPPDWKVLPLWQPLPLFQRATKIGEAKKNIDMKRSKEEWKLYFFKPKAKTIMAYSQTVNVLFKKKMVWKLKQKQKQVEKTFICPNQETTLPNTCGTKVKPQPCQYFLTNDCSKHLDKNYNKVNSLDPHIKGVLRRAGNQKKAC